MSIRSRVKKLEQHEDAKEQCWVIAYQDDDDPDLFRDLYGREYRRGTAGWPESIVTIIYNRSDYPLPGGAKVYLPDNGREPGPPDTAA